ncbi:MAG: hypothetical protein U1F37_11505 [Alphaproteobacteria bacterium]
MNNPEQDLCYTVTALVAAPARTAFDYLADGAKVGDWALGALAAKRVGDSDLFVSREHGIALRVDADPRRLVIDYHVGASASDLVMRIATRVIPGETMGRGAGSCLVSMAAWRPASFDDRRWSRLKGFHDAEIHLICEKIEALGAKNGRSTP